MCGLLKKGVSPEVWHTCAVAPPASLAYDRSERDNHEKDGAVTVRVFLLGQPQITRDDAPVPLSIAKAYGVLALLATGVQPRERVMELLWPERAPAVARKNLRNTLWALRRVLADDAVISTAAHLALTGSLWVDV